MKFVKLLLFVFYTNVVWSQPTDTTSQKGTLDKAFDSFEWYMKYFPVPYLSYSEETNWLFGISKFNALRLDNGDKQDTVTQASSITAFGYFTFNNQYKTALDVNLMLNKNKALWRTYLLYTDYPLEYFGVGNDTDLDDQRTLVTSDWQLSTYFLIRSWRKWYVGPVFDFFNFYDVELGENTDPLLSDSINLVHNIGRQAGLGLKVLMEGRDNRLNAKEGFYVDLSYQFYRQAFGSEYKYNHFSADIRYYTTPFKQLTIASQIKTESKTGDVPVQSLSLLGGDFAMRGTYRGRYRDNVLLDSQVELRFPIYWIFGGVVFNGIGQVAPAYDQLKFSKFHYNYGLGLRVMIDKEHQTNLRFDFGVSSDQTLFVINFAEAF